MARYPMQLIFLTFTATFVAGDRFYNFRQQICCAGVVNDVPKTGNGVLKCCGTDAYVPATNINTVRNLCCKNVLYENTRLDEMCCGNVTIDKTVKACLNDQIVVDIRKDDRMANRMGVCGVHETDYKAYDFSRFKCCGAVLHPAEKNSECCGQDYYNADTARCCDGFLYRNVVLSTTECCGQFIYDNTTNVCCEKDDNVPKNAPPVPKTVVSLDGRDPDKMYRFCNVVPYDVYSEVCCEDGPHKAGQDAISKKSCCNNTVIDTSAEACVRGEVKKIKPGQLYCGDKLYKPAEAFCFNKQPIRYGLGEFVCRSDGNVYNLTYQYCTTHGVETMTDIEFKEGKNSFCEVNENIT